MAKKGKQTPKPYIVEQEPILEPVTPTISDAPPLAETFSQLVPPPPAPEPDAPPQVRVGDLTRGNKFLHEGELYLKTNSLKKNVIGIRLVKHQFSDTFIPSGSITLDPDVLVIRK